MVKAILIICTSFLLFSTGCKNKCEPGSTRCHNNVAQRCRPDGRWDKGNDCSKAYGAKFKCCSKKKANGKTLCYCCKVKKGAK